MKKIISLLTITTMIIVSIINQSCNKKTDYDICIYGGTAGGVIAAYSAKKMGKSVLLIEPGKHIGGMTSGGLGATDIGNKYAVTGISRDFYRRLGAIYNKLEAWEFEPKVAEKVLNDYIKEAGVEVLYQYRIVNATKENKWIRSIEVENSVDPKKETNKTIRAKMFIDCSYEGDLMAKAGISYTIGREANSEYNETYNGVQLMDKHQFIDSISPYKIEGDSTSGLCWGISSESLAPNGTGDKKLQAYNYRLCITQDTSNIIPFSRPADYDSTKYELLRRIIIKREKIGWEQKLAGFYLRIVEMPNGKTDINNHGAFSTDMIGMNYDYPEATYTRRREIEIQHENYIRGLLYFLGHDPAIPQKLKDITNSWGWAKDEFTDNNYFPFQLYVREARRMIGEYVMTQHHCEGKEIVTDEVGMAAYTMDSHNCQRIVTKINGVAMVKNEGDVQIGGFPPYPISYRCIIPKSTECKNLLVPVCLSATHIAYGSIRMEPVFMVLGQSAAIAASIAIDKNKAIQKVNVKKIQKILTENPLLNGTEPEILVDNNDTSLVSYSGNWELIKKGMNQYKSNCMLSFDTTGKKETTFKFNIPIKKEGEYQIYYYCPTIYKEFFKDKKTPEIYKKWTNLLPAKLKHAKGETDIIIDMDKYSKDWAPLGTFEFKADNSNYLEINGEGIKSPIASDAILLIPVKK